MEVRKLTADDRVEADRGRVAIQRGPMIYCAEGIDNENGSARNLLLKTESEISSEYRPEMLNGTQVIIAEGQQAKFNVEGEIELGEMQEITMIPYHLWSNRGSSEMLVWLPG